MEEIVRKIQQKKDEIVKLKLELRKLRIRRWHAPTEHMKEIRKATRVIARTTLGMMPNIVNACGECRV